LLLSTTAKPSSIQYCRIVSLPRRHIMQPLMSSAPNLSYASAESLHYSPKLFDTQIPSVALEHFPSFLSQYLGFARHDNPDGHPLLFAFRRPTHPQSSPDTQYHAGLPGSEALGLGTQTSDLRSQRTLEGHSLIVIGATAWPLTPNNPPPADD